MIASTVCGEAGDRLEKGMVKFSGVIEILYILFCMMVTQKCAGVKIHSLSS